MKAIIFCILSSAMSILAQNNFGSCITAKTCGECLVRSPECAWCTSKDFGNTDNYPRCDQQQHLLDRGCSGDDVVSPSNEVTITGDDPLTTPESGTPVDELVQVYPQEINLKLRPGQTETITMDILQAEDFPVDLYYLMDLSDSMSDDLVKLRTLGGTLASEMKNITSNFRLGYGAFVDKKELPYVDITPKRLLNPCGGTGAVCEPPFGFHNVLPLTEETDRFSDEVGRVQSSGNLDNPEGGLDALMQATVCSDIIGWRKRARHMLLFSTDSPFHIAGDGKLGGIVMPNDGLCHTSETSGLYTESANQDYPSISQLSAEMKKYGILPVFAIGKADTTDSFFYYELLKEFFHEAYAERLSEDSGNVIEIVKDVYASITSGVKLEDDADKNIVDIGYTTSCLGDQPMPGESECLGLRLGDQVQFSLHITLKNTSCDGDKRSYKFQVGPTAFQENLVVNIEPICDCECSKTQVVSQEYCTLANGTYVCGSCICFDGRSGRDCECDRDEAEGVVDEACVAPDSEEKLECSGRGTCVCGKCSCDFRSNPREEISGSYCECDNFSCERYKGELCGGPARGDCICNETSLRSECVCHEGYINNNCNCSLSTASCIAPNGLLCNDEGDCECGACKCRNPEKFSGATCQLCKDCPTECDANKNCVQCKAFENGPFNESMCNACPHPIIVVEELSNREVSEPCVYTDDENCNVYFTHEILPNGTYFIEVQEERECPGTPEILWIILGIIIGIIFVGLALLFIWRLLTLIQDRKEFDRFEKDRAAVKWEASENPIYKPSTTIFKNPIYQK